MNAKHQLRIRDASQDRQPEIHSTLVREDSQRIMGQTNNDCRFRIFILTKQIAYLIFEYFRVTGANDSVKNYADLFTIALRNDDIQEFDSKWDGILLSMTKIPSDDILEGLYKLRIREPEELKTVLELYNMEIHQKKAGLENHRLKTMVKRSIEQNLRIKNFEARSGNYGQTSWSRTKGQRVNKELQEIVGNGKPTGSALKDTIAVSDTT